jgi:hypothetical protein
VAIHRDTKGAVYAFFAGESAQKLDSLQERIGSADPIWVLDRLEEIQPENCDLDRATFNEVSSALRAELVEMMR